MIPIPTGAVIGLLRDVQQRRRKVRLTVHRAFAIGPMPGTTTNFPVDGEDCYFITVTNASPTREIVVTHVWLETQPPVQVWDAALPVRLRHSARWETLVTVANVPPSAEGVEWRARCLLSPDDRVVKSRPRRNVPPFGTIPRG